MLKDFTKEKYDIILQAGQSNADGTGFGEAPNPYEPNDNVWYFNQNFTISEAAERVTCRKYVTGDLSLQFARRYIADGRLAAGRKLLIVRSAVGGTGFCDKRWGLSDDLYLQMMAMVKSALALNSDNRLAALLWHQGESDAFNGASFDTHFNNFSTLVNTVRNEFNVPNLPLVAGDFVQEWKAKNTEVCTPIVDAMRKVCAADNAAFVETDELPSNWEDNRAVLNDLNDDIHFCRAALYELGDRYYDAFSGI